MWARSDGRFEKSVLQVYNRIYLNFFCADHGIPQTFDETLMPPPHGVSRALPLGVSRGSVEGLTVFSLCPFPDESADVNQSWCQSVQPFGRLSRCLNF